MQHKRKTERFKKTSKAITQLAVLAFGNFDADLRYDHRGRKAADTGNGAQHCDGCAKRFDVVVDLLIDAGNGRIKSIDLV